MRIIDSKRVYVYTSENGGTEKDGIIYIRKGVADVSIGERKYAAVRVFVGHLLDDGLISYKIKGIAIYDEPGDIVPEGFDIAVYTRQTAWDLASLNHNKHVTINAMSMDDKDIENKLREIPESCVYLWGPSEDYLNEWSQNVASVGPTPSKEKWDKWRKLLAGRMVPLNENQRKEVEIIRAAESGEIKMFEGDWDKIYKGAYHDDERVQMVQNGIRN